MALDQIIDVILTPIAGGLGAFIGVSWVGKKNPEKYAAFASLGTRLGIGTAVTLGLFALKML